MAPEGATITLRLIVPQTVGSLEEVYTIIHDQIHTLLSKALQIIEQRAKDLQTTTDRCACFLAQHQKNWIYRRGADGLREGGNRMSFARRQRSPMDHSRLESLNVWNVWRNTLLCDTHTQRTGIV